MPATGFVVTPKVVAVAPAGTVTVPGTVAAPVFELVSFTARPAAGAGPVRITVPVDEDPPVTM